MLEEWSDRRDGVVGWIHSVRVVPGARGNGGRPWESEGEGRAHGIGDDVDRVERRSEDDPNARNVPEPEEGGRIGELGELDGAGEGEDRRHPSMPVEPHEGFEEGDEQDDHEDVARPVTDPAGPRPEGDRDLEGEDQQERGEGTRIEAESHGWRGHAEGVPCAGSKPEGELGPSGGGEEAIPGRGTASPRSPARPRQ